MVQHYLWEHMSPVSPPGSAAYVVAGRRDPHQCAASLFLDLYTAVLLCWLRDSINWSCDQKLVTWRPRDLQYTACSQVYVGLILSCVSYFCPKNVLALVVGWSRRERRSIVSLPPQHIDCMYELWLYKFSCCCVLSTQTWSILAAS